MNKLQLLTIATVIASTTCIPCRSENISSDTKIIRLGDTDYVASHSFFNLPDVVEIIFDGFIGHIDGYQVNNCPKLRRIVFNGPVFSTGGEEFARNCPSLKEVQFNGLVLNQGLIGYYDCDSLTSIDINGAIYHTRDSINFPPTPVDSIIKNPKFVKQIEQLGEWQIKAIQDKGWIKKIATGKKDEIRELADKAGLTALSDSIESTYQAKRDPDEGKTKLQILKESAPYRSIPGDTTLFTYTSPSDSLLTLSREYFNIDSIAGNGDDISRIKNLLYWIHDLVRHDGSSSWPDCHFNLPELVKVCREQDRGLNCRFMAFMLTEALLTQGIPARYITCQSKAWDEDNDCHVICVAWSESLNKWVWVDPTFAAYVTDENGLMLHPGEVRYRLQHDMPLVLNEDANWNHKEMQTKENYLDYYMAKNLYIMSAVSIQQSEPEGPTNHKRGRHIALTPVDFEFTQAHIIIYDDDLFWQSPK